MLKVWIRGEPFSEDLVVIPISPEIAVHSIIPMGTGPIGEDGDGMVEYASAHIEGVESELILPNAYDTVPVHSPAIEAVRRILPPAYRCRVARSLPQARSPVIVVMPCRSRDRASGGCRVLRVADPRGTAASPGANLAPLGSAQS